MLPRLPGSCPYRRWMTLHGDFSAHRERRSESLCGSAWPDGAGKAEAEKILPNIAPR